MIRLYTILAVVFVISLFVIIANKKIKILSFSNFKKYQNNENFIDILIKLFKNSYTWNVIFIILTILSISRCSHENDMYEIKCGKIISEIKHDCNCNESKYYVDVIVLLENGDKIKEVIYEKDYKHLSDNNKKLYCIEKNNYEYHDYTIAIACIFAIFLVVSVIITIIKLD